MKKFLSIFLTVIMVFAIAIPAFAEETGPFKIGETYFATLTEAITAAQPGDTIEMTEDVTYTDVSFLENSVNPYTITKNLTIDGGGHNLTFTCSADSVFPIGISGEGITVTFNNFGTISSTGGGFDCKEGTLKLTNLTAQSKGRVCIKTTSGKTAEIIVENATISNTADAGSSETTAILGGSGTNTITLKNGAVIQKNNPANEALNGAAAVIYTNNNGTHTINMEAGSKIVANHASGNTAGSVIGYGTSKSLTLNIADGAYLVVDSANLSTVNFIYSVAANTVNLTANDGAYLVKDSITPTLKQYQSGIAGSGKIYDMVALETSAVTGYKSYKMVENTNVDYDFTITTSDNKTVNVQGTLKDALNLASNGDTIKLLKQYDTTETGLSISGKSVTVDLNNLTLNATGSNYFFGSVKSGLTFKNGTMKVARGFIVQDGGHLGFENVTATSGDGTGSNSRPLVKLNGAGTTKLTVNNSTLESKSSIGEGLILVEQKTDGIITLTGNSVIKYSGIMGNNEQNHAAIAVQQAWASGQTDPGDGSWNTDLELNVGAGSSIIAAHASSTKTKRASAIADQTNGNITINLEAGATLAADRTYADDNASTTYLILPLKADGNTVVNNNGANFVISADVAKQGITLPVNAYGYKIGDQVVTLGEGNLYQNTEATEAVTITAVSYDFNPEMITGASIRLEQPFGLRFGATLSSDVYEMILSLDANAEFGFALAKKAKAGMAFDTTKMIETAYKLQAATATTNADGVFTFMTSVYVGEDSIIADATKSSFKEDIAARAYVKFTVNGEEVIYWADYNMSKNSRSLYDVAKSYYEDADKGATDNVVINHIIGVCETK